MRKYAENIMWAAIAVIGVTVTLSIAGCGETLKDQHIDFVYRTGYPTGATNVRILENGWYTFEWEGQCFLASKTRGTAGSGLLTRVDCE